MRRSGRAVRHHDQPLAHLPEHGPHQRVATRAREYMFLDDTACNLVVAQPDQVPATTTAASTSRATATRSASSSSRRRSWSTSRRYPTRADRARTRTTTVRSASATRTSARCSCCMGIPYDSRRGPRDRRRAHRDHVRPRLRASRRDGRQRRAPFAGYAKNREPMLRVMRMHRDAAYADRPRPVPRASSARAACEDWDDAVAARRAARLPQRAGDRARADRHDRPAHGLRHDGHRARLRAREVQEARRRRLLQDRQPVGAGGAAPARLRASRRSSEIVALRRRHEHARSAAPHVNRATLKRARASPTTSSTQGRGGAARRRSTLDCAFAPWVLGEDALRRGSASRRGARRSRASRCSRTSASRRREIERGERRRSRPHDGRGRAAPARPSTYRCSTARTAAARTASASSRRCATCA